MTAVASARRSAMAWGSPTCAQGSPPSTATARDLRSQRTFRAERARRSRFRMTRNSRQPTALIAEDEPMLRAQMRTRLTQAWPELAVVAEAENGEQALALQRELEPDIAFLDIRMPVRSGLEVAEALEGACHIVFVTAYD